MGEAADDFDRVFGGLDQVRELQERNQQLLGVLDAKNEEIAQLQELAEAATELSAGDAHAQKIVQLSKKNRNLGLALEKERALSMELATELRSAKAALAASSKSGNHDAVEDAARQVVQEAAEAAEAAGRDAASWREKYQQSTDRAIQAEAKAGMAKQEAEKLQRLLQREVGEGVDVAKVMDEGSGWRGRAQQIGLLKDKLREAQASGGGSVRSTSSDSPSRGAVHQEALRKNLDSLKEKRRQESDKVAGDLQAAREELEKLQLKCDGASSRKKVLENEVKGLKEKLAILLSKNSNDDKLIAALRAELTDLKRAAAKPPPGGPGSHAELQGLRQQLQEREAQVQRQELIIRTLEARANYQ
mmetsp:Transcript_32155/g.91223  ORF Transcript_32155/g.91223 Transcript_32155/m.91223 type:complete len:360 (+) Transcript_32155:129-1208(+)|eukprot:CAMPEP_0117675584 /NCGR_PEP_ID=MMETSP0804-20121206/15689_1 /TAXON_ID=1074897 /ORGANISM="Tetraselmis astigmatica, Strain CCMP880" /LENGTH=359 /DNA_ID=CAMNT_0005484609 /DNA_START=43 /DNA_END=1122 /DNA_ORIENTATION=+